MPGLEDISTLEEYLERYGKLLADQTIASLNPLHQPRRDPTAPILDTLLRRPFPAQAHCITAMAKVLDRERTVKMVGEMGTGKTLIGMAAAHAHARGKPYRGLIMAPDHLVEKWARELRNTIPGAIVTRFESWRDVLALVDRRAEKPTGPTWYILGRDQSKFDPAWEGRAARRWYAATVTDPKTDVKVKIRGFHLACPKCGAHLLDRSQIPLTMEDLNRSKKRCEAPLPGADAPEDPETGPHGDSAKADAAKLAGLVCGEPLWQFVAAKDKAARQRRRAEAAERGEKARVEPYRWAPARIIHGRLRRFFDYYIVDEVHEEISSSSAQANATGKLAAACRKTIALTGTIFGGYAWHLFPLMFRLCPRSLVHEGFQWGQEMAFTERYGRIEETVRVTETPRKGGDRHHSHSMGKDVRTERRKTCRPGIVPTVFGAHLMPNTVFLGLEEVSDSLPPRPRDEVWPTALDRDLMGAYGEVETAIRAYIAPMLLKGNTSLLGRMLQALLAYPDYPFGWKESGYLEAFGIFDPPDFDPRHVYPKERALIDFCRAERDAGRQVWVYTTMTGIRDVAGRLERLLRDHGLRAGALRASVDRRKREAWISKQGSKLDVAISHPVLVQTGLELFDLSAGVNFASIYWYQTGYNPFVLRQASRRAWRIGQHLNCRVAYSYYVGTMQERAVALMGRKISAAEQLDGRFSAEGLAAMAADESIEMALAKSLSERVESAERAWAKYTVSRPTPPPPAVSEPPAATRRLVQVSLFGE